MQLKRIYNTDRKIDYYALYPDSVEECAYMKLMEDWMPNLFEVIVEKTCGGLKTKIFLKIKDTQEKKLRRICYEEQMWNQQNFEYCIRDTEGIDILLKLDKNQFSEDSKGKNVIYLKKVE